jgi:Fur family ferric uptake transcriptional regulator
MESAMMAEKTRRNTRQRQVILEELQRLDSHPAAAELYQIVRRRLPKISLGTVYRNLELLVRNGVIRKLDYAGAESRFDADLSKHCHVRCVRCGRVDDADEVPGELAGAEFKTLQGYQILGCHLEFTGICPKCKRPVGSSHSKTARRRGN